MKTNINLNFENDVYKKYYALVYTTCRRFLKRQDLIEDATQSVFLLYIKKEESITSNLSSWFYWTSVNICKVVNADLQKLPKSNEFLNTQDVMPVKESENKEIFLELGRVLEKLPVKKRDMLFMRFYENLSYQEIGTYYKCKEDNVRKLIGRTLQYLESEIKKKGFVGASFVNIFFNFNDTNGPTLIPGKFIIQNSLLQQSLIKGVQKMYIISKLKIATAICLCLILPVIIPVTNYLLADGGDNAVVKPGEPPVVKVAEPDVNIMKESALKYLAAQQSADGSWSDKQYKPNSGITALCCLAFLAEGSKPGIGRFGSNIEKGLNFILKNIMDNGIISASNGNPFGYMYEHVFSTMVLLMTYKDMPNNSEIEKNINKAIAIINRSQKSDGGWRYEFSREGQSDMSVTSNVIWLMSACKKAGISIPEEAFKKGIGYIENSVTSEQLFKYRLFGQNASPSMDGLGVISLCSSKMDSPLIDMARNRIANDYSKSSIDEMKNRSYFLYGCFYASMAMFGTGEKHWEPWFQKTCKILMAIQAEDGSFQDNFENKVYSTAMAAIILQAPMEKLSFYQKSIEPLLK